jgi:protein gp37
MTKSAIEWTEATWNPVTGCTRVSAGCDNCYAALMSKRLEAMGQEKYAGINGNGHFNGQVKLHEDALTVPLKRKKPTVWFVNSMSDLFHPSVPFEFIDKVFAVMALCPQHTFQVLTKRPERACQYLNNEVLTVDEHDRLCQGTRRRLEAAIWDLQPDESLEIDWPLPGVWLGTSVEDQDAAEERIPHLLQCPAAVRFLSCEPLLGPVDLSAACPPDYELFEDATAGMEGWEEPEELIEECEDECDWINFGNELVHSSEHIEWQRDRDRYASRLAFSDGIHWVIAGGESGPNARPMHPDWVRSLRDQCHDAGVPFFFKQWGAWRPYQSDDAIRWESRKTKRFIKRDGSDPHQQHYQAPEGDEVLIVNVGKKAAGRTLDGETWDQMPETASCSGK